MTMTYSNGVIVYAYAFIIAVSNIFCFFPFFFNASPNRMQTATSWILIQSHEFMAVLPIFSIGGLSGNLPKSPQARHILGDWIGFNLFWMILCPPTRLTLDSAELVLIWLSQPGQLKSHFHPNILKQ